MSLCVSCTFLLFLARVFLATDRDGASGGAAAAAAAGGNDLGARALALSLVTAPTFNPWRASLLRGRLDWHDLVPLTFLVGARGEAAAEALNRHLREDAKIALLNVLQGRMGSAMGAASARPRPSLRRPFLAASPAGGLAAAWVGAGWGAAADGGPLAAFEGCPLVRDKCLLHSTILACLGNSLCGWCAASSTCLTRGGQEGVPCSPTPGTPRGTLAGALALSKGALLEDTAGVLVVSAATVPQNNASGCSIIMRESVLNVEIAGNSKMAYHWAGETLPSWVGAAAGTREGLGGVDNLVVFKGPWHDLLALSYIFSQSCPRSEKESALARVCGISAAVAALGGASQLAAVGHSNDLPLALFAVEASQRAVYEGLPPQAALANAVQGGGHRISLKRSREVLSGIGRGDPVYDPWLAALPTGSAAGEKGRGGSYALLRRESTWLAEKGLLLKKGSEFPELAGAVCVGEGSWGLVGSWDKGSSSQPLVVFISRLNKRLLLNEEELVELAQSLGARVAVVALENLPLCAQVRLFREAQTLVGMHGSGLINTMFMKPGSSVVQIVPYQLSGADTFFRGTAEAHGVRYFEVPTSARESTIAHAHFLKEPEKVEEYLQQGSGCCGTQTYFSFFINQDVVVDLAKARAVLTRALSLES